MGIRARQVKALALVVLLVAACGQPATAHSVRGASRPVVAPLTVLSVSFVTASRGWLLATPCADQPPTCRTVVVRETADGGRSWFPVSAPSAPPADMYQSSQPAGAVGTILFTSGGRGWAFGPALWQTTDGGATWRRVNGPGGQVEDVMVDAGRVLALTERCWPCRMQVYAAPADAAAAGTDDWRAVPGASSTGARKAV